MKRFIFFAYSLLLFTACVEEMEYTPSGTDTGNEIQVELNWTVAGMVAGDEMTKSVAAKQEPAPTTRVIPSDMGLGEIYDDNNPTIQNIWIIQFDGKTSGAKMLGAPRFLSVTDGDLILRDPQDPSKEYPLTISVPLVEVTTECYTLFVANIRQGSTYNWNLASESTFTDVMTRVKTIQAEGGAFEDFTALGAFPNGSRTLLMSAVTTSKVEPGTPLNPEFSRNVAKVTLNLSLSNTEMSIASIRMRNVSNSIVFADAALQYNGVSGSTIFPVDASVIDYSAITDPSLMPESGKTKTFSWYVPRNQQGVSKSTSSKEKTFLAPVNATFIEIVAVKGGENPSTSVFRIYPGADMVNDYNLTTNHEYTVGLNVVDIGTDPNDSRVQSFSHVVDYSGYGTPGSRSNSFIINPAPTISGINRTYLFGVHQVNRYWGDNAPGYGNKPENTIGDGESWVVSLIWSDLPGLFSTTTSTTAITLLNNNGTVVGGGIGPNAAFALSVPPNLPAGNFVLGIKKTNGENRFLWSWHFWVTDYAPDNFNRTLIDHTIYTYAVPGGQVERYVPGPNATNNNDILWTTDGLYKDKVMMDRNLGAVENFFSTTFSLAIRGMLHYQFGRKDPIPGNITLVTDLNVFKPYDNEKLNPNHAVKIAAGPVPIAETVATPWAFYTSSGGNWTNEADGTAYLWNDPYITTFEAGKSIYDPCPPGWKLPMLGTWTDFIRKIDDKYATVLNLDRDLGWTYGRGMGTADVTVLGFRYWPGTSLDAPVTGRIWYPAMGSRNGANGNANAVGSGITYVTATPSTAAYTQILSGSATSSDFRNNATRASGFPIRCIADNQ